MCIDRPETSEITKSGITEWQHIYHADFYLHNPQVLRFTSPNIISHGSHNEGASTTATVQPETTERETVSSGR